ncbi:unnamed protein product, partial [Rotaria magnacalcarata]
MIGGFQSCFNTGKFCRRCCINYEDRNLPLPLSHVKVRTVVDHDKTVQEIKSNPNKSSLMGVVGESPLHELIGFHPILSLPGDLMHDFIEDVWPIIIMSRLKQASSMRLITYDLALSYPFRKQWLPVLEDLCNTFNPMMILHFPTKIIPKVHFIREYERMIHDFGPSIKYWCFRYEAGHAYFKKIAMRTNNFKNTPKMLVTHYRLKQCFKFVCLSKFKNVDYSIGIKKIRSTYFNASMKTVLLKHFGRINFEDNFIQCK